MPSALSARAKPFAAFTFMMVSSRFGLDRGAFSYPGAGAHVKAIKTAARRARPATPRLTHCASSSYARSPMPDIESRSPVDVARKLAPQIRACAEETERTRELPKA